MTPNCIYARSKWLMFLCLATGLVFCSVRPVAASCSDNNPSDCPEAFTDGIYKKFNLDLGNAGRTHRWAIFTYGSGTSSSPFTALDVSSPTNTTQYGYQIMGDVAVAGAYANLNVSTYGSLSGDRYLHTTGTETKVGPNAVLAGSRFSSSSIDSIGAGAITALKNVSNTAAGFTKTSGSPTSINLNAGSLSFSNNPFNGKYVMQLSSLVMANNSVLTLSGNAGSAFVINVSGSFSLASSSQIVLSGGLTPSDVLFNVTGNSGAFSITGNSLLQGTLLAYNKTGTQRTLTVDGVNTLIRGQIIANKVVVSGGAKVRKPPKASCDQDRSERDREQERD
jgi:hypothetical protein